LGIYYFKGAIQKRLPGIKSFLRICEFIQIKVLSSRGCLGSILPLNWEFITLKEQSRRGCLGSNPSSGFVNLFITRSCPAEAARGQIPT
jgi:hypothetical protein